MHLIVVANDTFYYLLNRWDTLLLVHQLMEQHSRFLAGNVGVNIRSWKIFSFLEWSNLISFIAIFLSYFIKFTRQNGISQLEKMNI